MNLTLNGGTPQQRAWVTEAIAASTYPYESLDVPVTVTWAATTPCALKHTYMCTKPNGDGSFTITIDDWADDPNHPQLSGLPDPAADVKTFYMQSFVHETGHIAHFVMINSDPLRTQVASLFWKADVNAGTGRRYGTLNDYDHNENTNLTWADSIIEAVAECVKCAFYQGRLIYSNRTNWRIDEKNWPTLMGLLGFGGARGGWVEDFSQPPSGFGGGGSDYKYGGAVYGFYGTGSVESPIDHSLGYSLWLAGYQPFGVSACATGVERSDVLLGASIVSVKIRFVRIPPFDLGWGSVAIGRGGFGTLLPDTTVWFGRSPDTDHIEAHLDFTSEGVDLGAYGGVGHWVGPLWLVQRTTAGQLQSELWNADPFAAPKTARLAVNSISDPLTLDPQPARIQISNGGGDIVFYDRAVTDWTYKSLSQAVPPYPFASQTGLLAAGPGSAGQLRIAA